MNPNINIDFRVESDLYYLHILDLSCWGIAEDKPAVIEITLPGYKKPVKKYFPKKDVSYDSSNLGASCDTSCNKSELTDGIYHIYLKASPETFNHETYYLKTDVFQRDFDKLFIKSLEKDCTDCASKELTEISFRLEASHAYLRMGRISEAGKTFQLARRMLDKMLNCKNC